MSLKRKALALAKELNAQIETDFSHGILDGEIIAPEGYCWEEGLHCQCYRGYAPGESTLMWKAMIEDLCELKDRLGAFPRCEDPECEWLGIGNPCCDLKTEEPLYG